MITIVKKKANLNLNRAAYFETEPSSFGSDTNQTPSENKVRLRKKTHETKLTNTKGQHVSQISWLKVLWLQPRKGIYAPVLSNVQRSNESPLNPLYLCFVIQLNCQLSCRGDCDV